MIWQKQVQNISFQQNLLDISAVCGVKKFIGIGSQSEYGDFEGVIDESFPVNPKTAYAAVKLACLDLLRCFCEINQIEWYWFRLFPLFGPGESDRWLIPSLIKAMCTKDSMDLTPGEQLLPYLYVGECAKAIVSPLQTDDKSGIYNVCADNLFMGSHTEKLAQNLYTLDTTSFETHLQETIHHYVNLYTK